MQTACMNASGFTSGGLLLGKRSPGFMLLAALVLVRLTNVQALVTDNDHIFSYAL